MSLLSGHADGKIRDRLESLLYKEHASQRQQLTYLKEECAYWKEKVLR
jgi:hypothetical protein